MNDYITKVRVAAKARAGSPIYNGSLDHASVLAKTLVEFSAREVCVFSGSLDPKVFGNSDFIDEVQEFLGKSGRRMRIVVERPDEIDQKDHQFFAQFLGNTDVSIRTVAKEVADKIPYHFMVSDGDCYRFESDKNKPEAIASFGDETGGARLSGIFDILWNRASDWQDS